MRGMITEHQADLAEKFDVIFQASPLRRRPRRYGRRLGVRAPSTFSTTEVVRRRLRRRFDLRHDESDLDDGPTAFDVFTNDKQRLTTAKGTDSSLAAKAFFLVNPSVDACWIGEVGQYARWHYVVDRRPPFHGSVKPAVVRDNTPPTSLGSR